MSIFQRVLGFEDWRGVITLAFILSFTVITLAELLTGGGLEASKTLLPVLTLIAGFYFGERAGRRGR